MNQLFFALLTMPFAMQAAEPFLMFAADAAYIDPLTAPVIHKYFSNTDYLGSTAIAHRPDLKSLVPQAHQVQLSASLVELDQDLRAGCGDQTPGVAYYQWGDTPHATAAENADPLGSFAKAAERVRSTGCRKFGIVPEGRFFGVSHCQIDPNAAPYKQLDWTSIDYLDIMDGILLSDSCIGKASFADYTNLTENIVGFVRAKNPRIIVTAHLSFRNMPPDRIASTIRTLGNTVDGYFLAYPLNPATDHKYSTVENLESTLKALRTGK